MVKGVTGLKRLGDELAMASGIERKTAADLIVDMARKLAERAETISEITGTKLRVVMQISAATVGDELCEQESLPPLFDELRQQLHRIESAMNDIETSVDLVDI